MLKHSIKEGKKQEKTAVKKRFPLQLIFDLFPGPSYYGECVIILTARHDIVAGERAQINGGFDK